MIRLQDLLSEVSLMLPWRNQSARPMAAEMRSSVDPVLGPNATHMAPRKERLERLSEYRSKYSIDNTGTLKYKGATLKFRMTRRGRSSHDYEATLVSGKWPKDDDLVTLADGGDPALSGHPRHFGGNVSGHDSSKTKGVTVNVD